MLKAIYPSDGKALDIKLDENVRLKFKSEGVHEGWGVSITLNNATSFGNLWLFQDFTPGFKSQIVIRGVLAGYVGRDAGALSVALDDYRDKLEDLLERGVFVTDAPREESPCADIIRCALNGR